MTKKPTKSKAIAWTLAFLVSPFYFIYVDKIGKFFLAFFLGLFLFWTLIVPIAILIWALIECSEEVNNSKSKYSWA